MIKVKQVGYEVRWGSLDGRMHSKPLRVLRWSFGERVHASSARPFRVYQLHRRAVERGSERWAQLFQEGKKIAETRNNEGPPSEPRYAE